MPVFCCSGINPMQQQHCAKGLDISLWQHPKVIFELVSFQAALYFWQHAIVQTPFP